MENNSLIPSGVSICCLTYNHEAYIAKALDSFIMQATTFSFNIIIHDDASTDNTAQIIKAYAAKYQDLIFPIYQKENQYSKGINPAIEFVIPKCTGKYIAFCEGDDYWTDPNKLQKQVNFMEANPAYSLTFHNAEIMFENTNRKNKLFNQKIGKNVFTLKDTIELTKWYVPTPSILLRKEMLELPNWLKFAQQGDKAMQLLLATKGNFYYQEDVMCVYRKHATSLGAVTSPSNTKLRQIQMYSYFNLYTDFLYNISIEKKIRYFNNELEKVMLHKNKPTLKFVMKKWYKHLINYMNN